MTKEIKGNSLIKLLGQISKKKLGIHKHQLIVLRSEVLNISTVRIRSFKSNEK